MKLDQIAQIDDFINELLIQVSCVIKNVESISQDFEDKFEIDDLKVYTNYIKISSNELEKLKNIKFDLFNIEENFKNLYNQSLQMQYNTSMINVCETCVYKEEDRRETCCLCKYSGVDKYGIMPSFNYYKKRK